MKFTELKTVGKSVYSTYQHSTSIWKGWKCCWCRELALERSRWWFHFFFFSPRSLGKWSNLTSIFFKWVVQPSTRDAGTSCIQQTFRHTLLHVAARMRPTAAFFNPNNSQWSLFLTQKLHPLKFLKCICFQQLYMIWEARVYTVCIYDTMFVFYIDIDTDIFFCGAFSKRAWFLFE